jgi:3-isopropylmalate/(R)-2-methylmalate dehydratase small subunit
MTMQPFRTVTAVALPLVRDNIDTDTIIPSREIKSISKEGLAPGLFAGWRYQDADTRAPNPEFVLNDPAYRDAGILLGGANFGCGSSREHAVWALAEFGFRAIIAPSFAPIFFDNCINNGLLPAILPAAAIKALASAITQAPRETRLTVDLEGCTVSTSTAAPAGFTISADARTRLLEGLDAIAMTLRSSAMIDAFHVRDRERRPWVYLEATP